MITHLKFAGIPTRDQASALEFWTQKVGFTVKTDQPMGDQRWIELATPKGDTGLVLFVSIFDLLGQIRSAFSDPTWATPSTLFTGFAFAVMIYWVTCFSMSRYSLFVERRLNPLRGR